MRTQFSLCLLLLVTLNWMAYGQTYTCSTDIECQAFLNPTCGNTFSGICDEPFQSSDCDYFGTGLGYMITIDLTTLCTRTCLSNSDCSALPTAKICLTTTTPNYCGECETTADCTAMGFKNHGCPLGFCQYPSGSSGVCILNSEYYCSDPTPDCFDDTIRCWPGCTSNTSCTNSSCILGATGLTTPPGICSAHTNLPPSISSGCSSNSDCTTVSASLCSAGSCVACIGDGNCTHLTSTPYCYESVCVLCNPSNNSGCSSASASKCTSSPTYSCIACSNDTDCTHLSSTSYCDPAGGSCISCQPSDNSGCTTISAPVCSSSTYSCTTCTEDSGCTRFTSTPYCGGAGACVLCRTSDNSGCTSSAPKCISSPSYQCTTCTTDSDCTRFSSTPYCGGAGACTICQTSDNSGCTTITAPKCVSSPSYHCTTCTTDSDCIRFSSTPYCGGAGSCVLCRASDNSGCTSSTAPKCISPSYTCSTCTADADCSRFTSTPYCGASGACVQCRTSDNSGCTAITASKCVSSPSYSCTACSADADCTHLSSTPYCDGGTCVFCKTSDNTGCTGATLYCEGGSSCGACNPSDNSGCTTISAPICSSSTYLCTICTADSDCTLFPLTNYCGVAGTCVICRTSDNSGCTSSTAPKCISPSYTCSNCAADADCSRFTSTPYCGASGTCVFCKTSDNTGCTSANPFCISGSSCAASSSSSSCSTNDLPTGGSLIVTPTTGGTPLSTSFTATVSGWSSQQSGETLTFALQYIKASPLSSNPIQISDFLQSTQFSFYLPYTSTATIVAIIQDQSGCSTSASAIVTLTLSPPNGTDLLQSAISLLSKISLAGASDGVINVLVDQINIANQFLLCNNDLDSAGCNATQMMVCSTASGCSNQGQCTQNGCVCNQGYYLKDCSLNQSVYDLQTQLRQSLINSAATSMNNQNIPQMMSIINALTQNPYLNSNNTLNMTLSAATQAIQILNSSASNNVTSLSDDIQDISNVISNGFDQITQLDCGLYNNFSLQALNQSYDLLQQLSDTFVQKSSSNPSTTELNISTNAFLMYMGVFSSSQLNNLQINVSNSAPQLQISSLQNQASLPSSIALTYIYQKQNPLECDSSPSTNFTLDFKDAQTLQEVYPNASLLITYPQNVFGKVTCPTQCTHGNDPKEDATCSCNDISIFDMKNQLGRLYEESNLHLLTLSNFEKIFTSAIYLQWSFWVVVASFFWLVVTIIVVKTRNKDFCLARIARNSMNKNASRSGLEKFLWYLAAIHPLLGIYFYKGTYATSKAFRALIYFVRVMALLGTSAIFMQNPSNTDETVTFGGQILSLDIYLILAPLVIVMPIMFIIQKTLSTPKPTKKEKNNSVSSNQQNGRNELPLQNQNKSVPQATKRSRVVTFIGIFFSVVLAVAGVIAALMISLQINSNQQLSWAAKFTKSIIQDLFISPLLTLTLNLIVLVCKRRGGRIERLVKLLTDETIVKLSSGFNKRVPLTNIKPLSLTTAQQPLERPFESRFPPPGTMNRINIENFPSTIDLDASDLNHSNTGTNPIYSNFGNNLNESHNQLNNSSFHEPPHQRDNSSQTKPISIDLEPGGPQSRRKTTQFTRPLGVRILRRARRETQPDLIFLKNNLEPSSSNYQ